MSAVHSPEVSAALLAAFGFCGLFGTAVGLLAGWWARRGIPAAAEPPAVPPPTLPPLREREVQSALCVGDEEPWWRAVMQCIDVQRARCDAEAIDPANLLQPPLPAFYAGGTAHLDALKEFLREQRERGLRQVEGAE